MENEYKKNYGKEGRSPEEDAAQNPGRQFNRETENQGENLAEEFIDIDPNRSNAEEGNSSRTGEAAPSRQNDFTSGKAAENKENKENNDENTITES